MNELEDLKRQFDHWRKNKKYRAEPIPERLIQATKKVVLNSSATLVNKALGINFNKQFNRKRVIINKPRVISYSKIPPVKSEEPIKTESESFSYAAMQTLMHILRMRLQESGK